MPAFNKGETRAFKAVFEELYRYLVSLAFKIVGNHEDAEEVAMTAMQNTFNKCADFQYYMQMRKYLIISMRNTALNYVNGRNFKPILTSSDYAERFIENIKDDEYLMLDANVRAPLIAELYKKISKLKPSRRNVILLTLQEVPTKEIARRLGMQVHSVVVQRSRALQQLKLFFNTKTKHDDEPLPGNNTSAADPATS